MKKLAFLFLFVPSIAFAQAADPDFLTKAIQSLQQQRNNAMDSLASTEARLSAANEALAKANAKVKDDEIKLQDNATKIKDLEEKVKAADKPKENSDGPDHK